MCVHACECVMDIFIMLMNEIYSEINTANKLCISADLDNEVWNIDR